MSNLNIEESKDLLFYREVVFEMFKTNSKERISNGAPEHAACIFEAMFKNAKSSMKIFCSNLSKEVFENPRILSALEQLFYRNENFKLEVITQNEPDKTCFSEFLIEKKCLTVADNDFIKNIGINFAVMDGKAFRYEKDNSEVKAFACANDEKASSTLLDNFNLIKDAANA